MGLTHHKTVCSCGAVVAQCRCFDCNKSLIVKANACPDCAAKNPANRPAIVEHLPNGLKLTMATRDLERATTIAQLAAPDGTLWSIPLTDELLVQIATYAGLLPLPPGPSPRPWLPDLPSIELREGTAETISVVPNGGQVDLEAVGGG